MNGLFQDVTSGIWCPGFLNFKQGLHLFHHGFS